MKNNLSSSALRYNPLDMLDADSSDDEEMDELLNTTVFTPHKHKRKLIIGKRHSISPQIKAASESAEMTKEEIEAEGE
jgi:NAD(P)H-hydrate repair Nnr-like enzyme with NAD(P)H-hydrate dehydratase domain